MIVSSSQRFISTIPTNPGKTFRLGDYALKFSGGLDPSYKLKSINEFNMSDNLQADLITAIKSLKNIRKFSYNFKFILNKFYAEELVDDSDSPRKMNNELLLVTLRDFVREEFEQTCPNALTTKELPKKASIVTVIGKAGTIVVTVEGDTFDITYFFTDTLAIEGTIHTGDLKIKADSVSEEALRESIVNSVIQQAANKG